MLTSPQRLPADRVQAARAAAAALSFSAVRVGYVAAAMARAGNHGGYPQGPRSGGVSSSSCTSPANHSVAAAAVRAAAAHPQGGPLRRPSTAGPEDVGGPLSRPSSAQASCAEVEEKTSVPSDPPAADTDIASDQAESEDCGLERDNLQPARVIIVSEARSVEPVTTEPTNSDRTLGTIVVGPSTDEHETASDEALASVWDVVVEKTFISVVPRRHVLPHSASAPGCLGILGEAGRTGGRPRRARSSRRRSRRKRAGTEQAAAGNSAQLH